MKKRRKTNLNQGITLIALVITIIVLLILVGVSIATLTGENGILTKAVTAKKETDIATEDEKVKLAVASAINNDGEFDSNLFITEITNQGLSGNSDTNGNIVVNTKNKTYTISDKGKITETNKTNTDEEEQEPVTVPESYVKSFNAGKDGNDNVIGYIVNNSKSSNAYDMIFIGAGEMGNHNNANYSDVLKDYASFASITTWKADFINIKIGSGITNIPEWTFNGSKTLENVILPNTIERIEPGAFSTNTNIKNITIPSSVKQIQSYAFGNWTTDQTITIMGSTEGWSSSWSIGCNANIIYQNQ